MIEELIIRALCDTLPQTVVDAVFLFGQTEDSQRSVLDAAAEMQSAKKTKKILFINSEPISGYPGFEQYKKELLERGVSEDEIEPVPIEKDTQQLNTRIEAEAFVKHAKSRNYKHVIVMASPFQQPRAFMAAVTAVLSIYPALKVYSKPGKALSWQEKVKHSQGKLTGTRAQLITDELERIKKYNTKGDLATADVVLQYLNDREF